MMKGRENRDTVLCNNCQWAASLLSSSTGFSNCPFCGNSLETIPVDDHESYTMRVHDRTIEIEFDKE